MPYRPLKIAIPEPCDESWEGMLPVEGTPARHCFSCEKNVIDFTGFTDAQMHAYARKHGGKMCGRFRPDQLNRPIRAKRTPNRSPFPIAVAAAGVLLAATGCDTIAASQQPTSEPVQIKNWAGDSAINVPIVGGITTHVGSSSNSELDNPQEELDSPLPECAKKEFTIREYVEGDATIHTDTIWPDHEMEEVMGIMVFDQLPVEVNQLGFSTNRKSVLPNLPALFSKEFLLHPQDPPKRPQQELSALKRDFRVFPNPFTDHITIEALITELKPLTVELIDPAGRRVHLQTWEPLLGKRTLRLEPRPKLPEHATYYLRISNGRNVSTMINLL